MKETIFLVAVDWGVRCVDVENDLLRHILMLDIEEQIDQQTVASGDATILLL